MKGTILGLALLVPMVSWGAVYKCTDDKGRAVFSQSPCGVDAAEIELENSQGNSAPTPDGSKFVQQTNQTIESNQIKREIRKLESDIESYQRGMEGEIASLRYRSKYANNNLAGATWQQSLAKEMEAVTQKYQSKIQVAQSKIARLEQRLNGLGEK